MVEPEVGNIGLSILFLESVVLKMMLLVVPVNGKAVVAPK